VANIVILDKDGVYDKAATDAVQQVLDKSRKT
jgi:hypothetical protein